MVATSREPIKIFIGSGEASRLECRVLIYSLRKHSRWPLDIHVFNGTHNAIEVNDRPPIPAPMSLRVKYLNVTEFSLYRFLIPALCGQIGRAIYLDSDMLCLRDIGEVFEMSLNAHDLLAKRGDWGLGWALSVILFDCGRCSFDLEHCYDQIDRGMYTYEDLASMTPRFLECHPLRIGELDPRWNVFDDCREDTRLIHYTNLLTQPWKTAGHPQGEIWMRYLREAMALGVVTSRDVELGMVRSYVRRDLLTSESRLPMGIALVRRQAQKLRARFRWLRRRH